jgi:hypothetical protein
VNAFTGKTSLRFLIPILAIALVLRLVYLNCSFWIDEMVTAKIASSSWDAALTSTPYPVLFIVCRAALLCLGDSEGALRLPMVFAGLGAIAATYAAGRRVYAGIGLAAAALLTMNATHVYFSQDARYYGLIVLFAALLLLALDYGLHSTSWLAWIGVAILIPLSILTTPVVLPFLFAAGVAAVGAIVIVHHREQSGSKAKRVFKPLAGFGSGLALYAIALVALTGWEKFPTYVFTMLSDTPGGPVFAERTLGFGEYFRHIQKLFFYGPAHTVAGVLLAILAVAGFVCMLRTRPMTAIVLAGVLVVTPLPMFLISVEHFYAPRYFAALLPVVCILAATGCHAIATIARRLARGSLASYSVGFAIPLALLLGFSVDGLSNYYSTARPMHDWKGLAKRLSFELSPSDTIVHFDREFEGDDDAWHYLSKGCLDFYLARSVAHGHSLVGGIEEISARNEDDIAQIARERPLKTIWIVDSLANASAIPQEQKPKLGNWLGDFERIRLFRLAAPGTNMIVAGGFEGPEGAGAYKSERFGSMSLVNGPEALEGTSLRIDAPIAGRYMAKFPITGKLDQGKRYTLSLCVKLSNRYSPAKLALASANGAIVLSFGDTAKPLAALGASHDWEKYEFELLPGENIPADATDMTLSVGFIDSAGSMLTDNVMCVEGPPRSFINTFVPPRQ